MKIAMLVTAMALASTGSAAWATQAVQMYEAKISGVISSSRNGVLSTNRTWSVSTKFEKSSTDSFRTDFTDIQFGGETIAVSGGRFYYSLDDNGNDTFSKDFEFDFKLLDVASLVSRLSDLDVFGCRSNPQCSAGTYSTSDIAEMSVNISQSDDSFPTFSSIDDYQALSKQLNFVPGILTLTSFASYAEGDEFYIDQFDVEFTPTNFSLLAITDSTVPEPATWLMMIVGFGLVGGAVRQRRNQVALLSN